MRKKAAGFFLALTMITALFGCGKTQDQTESEPFMNKPGPAIQESVVETPTPETAEADEGGIYLIIPTEVGLSAQEEAAVISGARKEGYQVTVKTYGNDSAKQTEAFDAAIDAEASIIICDNIDNEATTASVQKAKDAGIPTILMNRGIKGTGTAVAQILTDRYVCISRLAELFAEKVGKSSDYAYIYTSGNTDMADDVQSFSEALSSYKGMKSVDQVDSDEYNMEAVKETIRQLLTEKPEIDTLVCGNGMQAHAAIKIAEEAEAELMVICLDGDDEVSTKVLSGQIYASIIKPAEDLGVTAIRDAVAYLKNGTTGENERMYYAGMILTTNEIVTVVSPTPTEAPDPETSDSSDLSSVEVVIDESDSSMVVVEIPDESVVEDVTVEVPDDMSEGGNDDIEIEIVDASNYDDGGEGRPDMQ